MRVPAEEEEQSGVLVAFPHKNSDWRAYLREAEFFYNQFITEIAKREKCIVLANDAKRVAKLLPKSENIIIIEIETNDTWSRDFGAISIQKGEQYELLNFGFNGWGLKFASNFDNQITPKLYKKKIFKNCVLKTKDLILEGGSIESNGHGVIMTTSKCLLEKNRNPHLKKSQIEKKLKKYLGAKKILWLKNGFLVGDDTDSHIDVLARFVDRNKIMYIKSSDPKDAHYSELQKMEEELKSFSDENGKEFELIPLPMTEAIYHDGERLPASYANFLIINGAVIIPTYKDKSDTIAVEIFKKTFKDREIIPLDASVLVRQHGSIHCVSMQFPKNLL